MGDEFGRAVEGVEEEAAAGRGFGFEGIEQGAPCFEGVDGQGELALAGEGELGEEDVELLADAGLGDPAIEPAFADRCLGEAIEQAAEGIEPAGAALVGEPGMESKGGVDETGVALSEGGDLGPIGLRGAINHAALDPGGLHFED